MYLINLLSKPFSYFSNISSYYYFFLFSVTSGEDIYIFDELVKIYI